MLVADAPSPSTLNMMGMAIVPGAGLPPDIMEGPAGGVSDPQGMYRPHRPAIEAESCRGGGVAAVH
jgi:hypothetical protein